MIWFVVLLLIVIALGWMVLRMVVAVRDHHGQYRSASPLLTVLLVVACILAAVVGYNTFHDDGGKAGANESQDDSTKVSPTEGEGWMKLTGFSALLSRFQPVSQEVVDLLTVDTVSNDCVDSTNGNVPVFDWDIGALYGTPPRLWSDGMSVPIGKTVPSDMLEEVQGAICHDPLLGTTWAHFFAHMQVGNVQVVGLNDWLKPFAGDASGINDQAAGFIPLLDVKDPSAEQVTDAVSTQAEYVELAERVNTLLSRFMLGKVEERESVLNYHLEGGAVVAGGLPEVGLNPNQENLPALLLSITEKGACAPLKVIGINVGDKRPEEFAPPTCEAPPPPPPPPATTPTTVTTTPPPATTPTTSTSTTSSTTPPPPPPPPPPPTTACNKQEDCHPTVPTLPATTTTRLATTTTVATTATTLPPATTSPPRSTTTRDSGDGQTGSTIPAPNPGQPPCPNPDICG